MWLQSYIQCHAVIAALLYTNTRCTFQSTTSNIFLCAAPPPTMSFDDAELKQFLESTRHQNAARIENMKKHNEAMRKRREAQNSIPFRDSTLMLGPPGLSIKDFRTPRLRQCPFDMASIKWGRILGYGIEGCVWKVYFEDEGPYALKVVRPCL